MLITLYEENACLSLSPLTLEEIKSMQDQMEINRLSRVIFSFC